MVASAHTWWLRGPSRPFGRLGATSEESILTLNRLRQRSARVAVARVPERPPAVSMIRPQIEIARGVGVTVDELDGRHVMLNYDARDRDHWLAADAICDAVFTRSTIEGDRSFDSAPRNWLLIHFDYGACGWDGSDGRAEAGPSASASSALPRHSSW